MQWQHKLSCCHCILMNYHHNYILIHSCCAIEGDFTIRSQYPARNPFVFCLCDRNMLVSSWRVMGSKGRPGVGTQEGIGVRGWILKRGWVEGGIRPNKNEIMFSAGMQLPVEKKMLRFIMLLVELIAYTRLILHDCSCTLVLPGIY